MERWRHVDCSNDNIMVKVPHGFVCEICQWPRRNTKDFVKLFVVNLRLSKRNIPFDCGVRYIISELLDIKLSICYCFLYRLRFSLKDISKLRDFRQYITVRWAYFDTLFVTLAGHKLVLGLGGGAPRSSRVLYIKLSSDEHIIYTYLYRKLRGFGQSITVRWASRGPP